VEFGLNLLDRQPWRHKNHEEQERDFSARPFRIRDIVRPCRIQLLYGIRRRSYEVTRLGMPPFVLCGYTQQRLPPGAGTKCLREIASQTLWISAEGVRRRIGFIVLRFPINEKIALSPLDFFRKTSYNKTNKFPRTKGKSPWQKSFFLTEPRNP